VVGAEIDTSEIDFEGTNDRRSLKHIVVIIDCKYYGALFQFSFSKLWEIEKESLIESWI